MVLPVNEECLWCSCLTPWHGATWPTGIRRSFKLESSKECPVLSLTAWCCSASAWPCKFPCASNCMYDNKIFNLKNIRVVMFGMDRDPQIHNIMHPPSLHSVPLATKMGFLLTVHTHYSVKASLIVPTPNGIKYIVHFNIIECTSKHMPNRSKDQNNFLKNPRTLFSLCKCLRTVHNNMSVAWYSGLWSHGQQGLNVVLR